VKKKEEQTKKKKDISYKTKGTNVQYPLSVIHTHMGGDTYITHMGGDTYITHMGGDTYITHMGGDTYITHTNTFIKLDTSMEQGAVGVESSGDK
jgi:hypothetical protein